MRTVNRILLAALLLGLASVASAQVASAQIVIPPPGVNPQGRTFTSGATCPPVATPHGGTGSIYTCTTDGTLYSWDGGSWNSIAGGGGGGGSINGTISANQVAVGASSNTIGGSAGLTSTVTQFTASPKQIDVDASPYTPTMLGDGSGNVSNGVHRYKFVLSDGSDVNNFDSPWLHTANTGDPTPGVTVADNTADGVVRVSIPAVCYTNLPYVHIYRDKDGDGAFKWVGTEGWDCEGWWNDNVADADLGPDIPTINTARIAQLSATGSGLLFPDSNGVWGAPIVTIGDNRGNGGDYTIAVSDAWRGNGPSLTIVGSSATGGRFAGGTQGGGINIDGGYGISDDGNWSGGANISVGGGASSGGVQGGVSLNGSVFNVSPPTEFSNPVTFDSYWRAWNGFPDETTTSPGLYGGYVTNPRLMFVRDGNTMTWEIDGPDGSTGDPLRFYQPNNGGMKMFLDNAGLLTTVGGVTTADGSNGRATINTNGMILSQIASQSSSPNFNVCNWTWDGCTQVYTMDNGATNVYLTGPEIYFNNKVRAEWMEVGNETDGTLAFYYDNPTIATIGNATDIDLFVQPKGSGITQFAGGGATFRRGSETPDAVVSIFDNGTDKNSVLDVLADDDSIYGLRVSSRVNGFGLDNGFGLYTSASDSTDGVTRPWTAGGSETTLRWGVSKDDLRVYEWLSTADGDYGSGAFPRDTGWAVATVDFSHTDSWRVLGLTNFLQPPSAAIVTNNTSGSTTVIYRLVGITPLGYHTAAGAESTTTTSAASPDNNIADPQLPGVVAYDIYRTVGGSTQGYIGTVNVGDFPFVDNDLAADGTNVTSYVNTTGHVWTNVQVDAPAFSSTKFGVAALDVTSTGTPGDYTLAKSGIVVRNQAGDEVFRIWGTDPSNDYGAANFYAGGLAGFSQPSNNVDAGYYDVGIGAYSMYSNTTGFYDTAVGYGALYDNTTGSYNVGVGTDALFYNTTGSGIVSVGVFSGFSFDDDGIAAHQSINDTDMVFVGRGAYRRTAGTDQSDLIDGIAIGADAFVTASHHAVLGSATVTDVYFGSEDGRANVHGNFLIPQFAFDSSFGNGQQSGAMRGSFFANGTALQGGMEQSVTSTPMVLTAGQYVFAGNTFTITNAPTSTDGFDYIVQLWISDATGANQVVAQWGTFISGDGNGTLDLTATSPSVTITGTDLTQDGNGVFRSTAGGVYTVRARAYITYD